MQLVRPTAKHEQSLTAYLAELREANEELVPWVLAELGHDFQAYLAWLKRGSLGRGLRPGFVPSSTFWLLDSADEIVAVSNVRHRLTDSLRSYGGHIGFGVRPSARRKGHATEILRRTLVEARKLGIEDVLLTCDKGNIGSARAILRNGGEFSGEEYMAAHSSLVQRYWIRAR